jgi:hypothetical protein
LIPRLLRSRRNLLALFLCLFQTSLLLAKPRSGLISTDFDGKPSGARYIGMGDSGAALSGLPESPVYNPATLHDVPAPLFSVDLDVAHQSTLSETEIVQGVPLRGRKLTYLGFAAPDAAFFYRPIANYDDTTVTNTADPENNFTRDSFELDQIGFSVAQATEKDKKSAVGLTISYLMAHRATAEAATGQPPKLQLAEGNGFSIDLGILSRSEYFSFGVGAFNLPGIIYWNAYKPDQLPINLRGGVLFHPVPMVGFSTEYEKRFYRGDLPRPDIMHFGAELTPFSWIQIRGGIYGEDLDDVNKTTYTSGFSMMSSKRQRIDFAMRAYRINQERVYNYYVTLILPLPGSKTTETSTRSRYSSAPQNVGDMAAGRSLFIQGQ